MNSVCSTNGLYVGRQRLCPAWSAGYHAGYLHPTASDIIMLAVSTSKTIEALGSEPYPTDADVWTSTMILHDFKHSGSTVLPRHYDRDSQYNKEAGRASSG